MGVGKDHIKFYSAVNEVKGNLIVISIVIFLYL